MVVLDIQVDATIAPALTFSLQSSSLWKDLEDIDTHGSCTRLGNLPNSRNPEVKSFGSVCAFRDFFDTTVQLMEDINSSSGRRVW